MLDVDVTVAADGRHTTQARATGHVVDTEIVTANGALGERPFESSGSSVVPPDVPGPEDCGPRSLRYPGTESIMSRLDVRLASAREWEDIAGNPVPGGRSALWAPHARHARPVVGGVAGDPGRLRALRHQPGRTVHRAL